MFCFHVKFQVYYSSPSCFFLKPHIFTHFCGKNIFHAKYLRFYTSTKYFIKIQPKMSKRKPIKKKKLFYPLPLLIYSALYCIRLQLIHRGTCNMVKIISIDMKGRRVLADLQKTAVIQGLSHGGCDAGSP